MKKSTVIITIVVVSVLLVFCVLPVLGLLVAITVPGFLRAREISRRNVCQENQTKIEVAVLQYVLEHRLTAVGHDGGTGFLDFVGNPTQDSTNQTVWMSSDDPAAGPAILFGESEYVRFVAICPAGGLYRLQDPESPSAISDNLVYCTLRHRTDVAPTFFHVFPGEDANAVLPLPGQ